jgi:(2Fe-2S) ferredoxin
MNMRLKALKRHLFFCHSEHCENQEVEDLMEAFKEQLVEAGINKQVMMNKTSCLGICGNGPFALVYPDGIWYYNLTVEDVPKITMEHLVNNEPVEELIMLKISS